MSAPNVYLKKIVIERGEADADFPYTVSAYGQDADTDEPLYITIVNSGAFVDAGAALSDAISVAGWIVIN